LNVGAIIDRPAVPGCNRNLFPANTKKRRIFGTVGDRNENIQHPQKSHIFSKEIQNVIDFTDLENLENLLNQNLPTYVAHEEKNKAMKVLFEKGIPFTPDCFSFQIAKNDFEICELFFKAGMDINERDSAGTPFLCAAARNGKKDMVQWLLEKGADIDAISRDRGYSAVMDAVWKSNKEIVELLVNKGANLNFVSRDGQTALILATGSGNFDICRILAENGADPTIKDRMGMSSIDYATLFKKEEILNLYKQRV
jgi:ankyrin repeat protein